MTATPDSRLERFVRHRDETSFRELYRAHSPRLFALAMRLTAGRRHDSEELVQETWVRAVERLERFRRRSSFRTWLSGILVNCYRETVRRRSRGPRSLEEAGVEAAVERELASPPRDARAEPVDVERAIARLADGYREVLVLHDLEGHTHQEIAALLGIEPGTSKSQLARGRRRLRELLTGDRPKGDRREGRV